MRYLGIAVFLLYVTAPSATAQSTSVDSAAALRPAESRLEQPMGSGSPGLALAARTLQPPIMDGADADAIWSTAQPIGDFYQFVPTEGGIPSMRTEARVAYDDRNLYVFVRAFDPHPDSIIALLSRRDVRTNSEWIKVVIDAYHDRRTGVELMVNPAGVKRDASIYNDITEDNSWDGVWDVATKVDSLGWSAEFRIPFSQLRFTAAPSQTFGFAIWRDIARRNERVSWPLFRPSRLGFASQLGTITGFTGIPRTSRFELLPYVIAKSESEQQPDGWRQKQKLSAGGDVKYGITSNLTLDATVNPDFGQVEADPAVLNLTAFETRFEERRPFFQEGVGLFKCGGPCEGIFYSRRIGRSPQLAGSPRDPSATTILGATKVTGRLAHGVSVGLVEALTRREEGVRGTTIEPQTNYFVGRGYKELSGGSSGAGAMVTAVNRNLDDDTEDLLRRDAYTLLLQGFHRFGGEKYELMAYTGLNRVGGSEAAIARTQRNSVHLFQRPDKNESSRTRRYDSTLTSLSGTVAAVQFQTLGGSIRYSTFIRNATAGVELNDLGFVPLVDDRSIRNSVLLQTSRPGKLYRRAFTQVQTENHWTTGNLNSATSVALFNFAEFPNSWSASAFVQAHQWGGTHCIACARGGPAVRQSPGFFSEVSLDGDPRGVLIPHGGFSWARDDEGRSYQASLESVLDFRAGGRFSMSAGPRIERQRNDQQWIGNFGYFLSDTTHYTFAQLEQTTVSMTLRASFAATPQLSFQLYGEPFVSGGSFADWRELDRPRSSSYAERYRPYSAINPDGFNVKSFNSNIVARWEYRPGSTLFAVWQQGRQQDELNPGNFEFRRDYRDLFRAHPENTFLIKASYWFNP